MAIIKHTVAEIPPPQHTFEGNNVLDTCLVRYHTDTIEMFQGGPGRGRVNLSRAMLYAILTEDTVDDLLSW